MKNPEQQPNNSNLESLEIELSLTKAEMEEYRKLPKEEQEKQKDERISKLKGLQTKLDEAIQDAIKTGRFDEAKKLKEVFEHDLRELERLMDPFDIETFKKTSGEFLRRYYTLAGIDKEIIKKTKFLAQIVRPKDEDYESRINDHDVSKFGQFTINPDTQDMSWEDQKNSLFIPDLSFLKSKSIKEVVEYMNAVSPKGFSMPGIEYWKRIIEEDPDMIPDILKDTKLYFLFLGTISRNSKGDWGVLGVHWVGKTWSYWADISLSNRLDDSYRVVLLKK